MAESWLGWDFYARDYQVLGEDKPSRHWAVRFVGPVAAGARAAEQALGLLKKDEGRWKELWTKDHQAADVQVFAGPDKNRMQVRREIMVKRLREVCEKVVSRQNLEKDFFFGHCAMRRH